MIAYAKESVCFFFFPICFKVYLQYVIFAIASHTTRTTKQSMTRKDQVSKLKNIDEWEIPAREYGLLQRRDFFCDFNSTPG